MDRDSRRSRGNCMGRTMDTSETAESKSPTENRVATKNVKRWTYSQVEETRQDESEAEVELVRSYRQHPLGALFPPVPANELQAWATDIRKNGQRHDIVRHLDGSILDGWNT